MTTAYSRYSSLNNLITFYHLHPNTIPDLNYMSSNENLFTICVINNYFERAINYNHFSHFAFILTPVKN